MAEPQTPTTEQPAQQNAPGSAQEETGSTWDSVVEDISKGLAKEIKEPVGEEPKKEPESPAVAQGGGDTKEPASNAEEQVPEEPEKKEEDSKEKQPPLQGAIEDDALFTDEALATPEGLAEARRVIQETRRKSHKTYLGLQQRESRFERVKNETLAMRKQVQTVGEMLNADLSALQSNDPNLVLTAFARLTKQDPVEAYNSLTAHLAGAAEAPQESAGEKRLRARIEELENGIRQRDLEAKQEAASAEGRQVRYDIAQRAQQFPEQLPWLSELAKKDPHEVGNYVAQYILDAQNAGHTNVTWDDAYVAIERSLTEQLGQKPKPAQSNGAAKPQPAAATKADPGQPSGGQKAEEAQSTPIGRSLSPSQERVAGVPEVELTEDERLDRLAHSMPDTFFTQLSGEVPWH